MGKKKDKKNKEVVELAEKAFNKINTYSRPSDLKITDMRIAVVCANYDYPIIRIDTNQGIYGLGEVRDAGHKENALQFKSMLLGQNPCISTLHGFCPSSMLLNCKAFSLWPASRTSPNP